MHHWAPPHLQQQRRRKEWKQEQAEGLPGLWQRQLVESGFLVGMPCLEQALAWVVELWGDGVRGAVEPWEGRQQQEPQL